MTSSSQFVYVRSSSLLLYQQDIVTTALQKFPGLFVFCFVDLPADAIMLQVPSENRACKRGTFFPLPEGVLIYLLSKACAYYSITSVVLSANLDL